MADPHDLPSSQIWVPSAPRPTSRRVLPPGEYDKSYRQDLFCVRQTRQPHRMMSPFATTLADVTINVGYACRKLTMNVHDSRV